MFGKSITLFRPFGFAVRVDTSWIFIAGLVTWTLATSYFPNQHPELSSGAHWLMGVLGAVGLFLSVVFHELSHSLVARRFGIEMRGITLFIFGGVAEMGREPPGPRAEFLVAGVGPLSSLVLSGLAYLTGRILPGGPVFAMAGAVFGYLAVINLVLALFNLVPAFPLDGGRLLRAVLWGRRGSISEATRITSRLGSGFGMLLIVIGGITFIQGGFVAGAWWVLIGMFLRGAAGQAYQQVVVRRSLEGEPVGRFMTVNPVTVDPDTYVRDLVEGYIYRTHHKLYPVVQDGELLGCVTLARVKEIPREKWDWIRVRDVADRCSEANTIFPSADAMEALNRMQAHRVSRLLVVEDGILVGILSLRDLMAFLSMKTELESG